jgi:hypothetical protein
MTLFGFKIPRLKELDFADEADEIVSFRSWAIKTLNQGIRDSLIILFEHGFFFLVLFAMWALSWPSLARSDWEYLLLASSFAAGSLSFNVVFFVIGYMKYRAYKEALFLKRLVWPEVEGY